MKTMKGENMSDVQGSLLGNAVLRREDPDLLIGAEKYFDDIEVQGLGYVYFARSSVAHATINSIETSSAKEIDGVTKLGDHIKNITQRVHFKYRAC